MTLISKTLAVSTVAGLLLAPAAALADQTTTPVATAFAQSGDNVSHRTFCLSLVGVSGLTNATLAQLILYGDCQINFRNLSIGAATTRVNQMERVATTTRQSLLASLQTTLGSLATIKTTLDAETASTTALADVRQITRSVRVYALQLPRTWILAAADRVMGAGSIFQTLLTDLTNRNNTLGDDQSAVKAANAALLADMSAKMADAATQATNAQAAVISLVPDNGDQALRDSNHAAIVSARAMLTTAQNDLKAAREDARKVDASLSGLNH